jgi:hypothetical protein
VDTANDAVLEEGRRVLISDPHRLDGVVVVGVDEHLAAHVRAVGASVAADRDQPRGGAPPERLVCQPPGHRAARRALASAAPAPPVELARLDPAGQHRPIRLEPLADDVQAEFVEAAERTQVRAHEGSAGMSRSSGWLA